MNITEQARKAAEQEVRQCWTNRYMSKCYRTESGHFVQLAINAACAEKDAEIERLTREVRHAEPTSDMNTTNQQTLWNRKATAGNLGEHETMRIITIKSYEMCSRSRWGWHTFRDGKDCKGKIIGFRFLGVGLCWGKSA